ncbi:MAG: polysaccharide deacetylase family protein [Clostridiales bacterium]|nr:polysaccharide deacetylase family protein [Clostridiales bacterium]
MANVFMRYPEGRAKALTLSYDDGVEQDIQLIDIMNKHKLKGTFNLNSGLYASEGTVYPKGQIHRRMSEKKTTEIIKNSGQEAALHSLTHPYLEQLPADMLVSEIMKDRENLEKQFDTIVRGMAYPFGTFNDSVVNALQSCGIAYSRTTISTNDFRMPKDWLRLTATCHHNSPELQNLANKFVEEVTYRTPYLFYLWGHSYEYESNNNWNVIEKFAGYIGNRDDIWYATNIEIFEYIDAYNRLVFSTYGKRVKNPTDRKVWFEYSGTSIPVEAGATIEI